MNDKHTLAPKGEARNGFTKIPNWIFTLELTSHELSVFVVLCHHLPKAYPSLERLTAMSGLSRSSVIRALASLETKNLIIRDREQYKTTHYRIRLKPPTQMEQLLNQSPGCHTDTPSVTGTLTSVTQTPDQCHTDTQTI
jgi:hypothetical protein